MKHVAYILIQKTKTESYKTKSSYVHLENSASEIFWNNKKKTWLTLKPELERIALSTEPVHA